MISTNTPWESRVGYARAVRVGPFIFVSGTTAVDEEGRVLRPGDVYGQSVQVLQKIQVALERSGAGLRDVVRTRIYLTDIEQWKEVGRAHGEFFGTIRPATSMVEVRRLISPGLLVEIEADAVASEDC